MKPSADLKRLLRVDVSPDSPYSELEVGLATLERIVKSTSQREVVVGGVRKMFGLFHSKSRVAKLVVLRYLSRVRRYVDRVDTNILHMFYSTDARVNDLAVRYVRTFSRFFRDNDVVFYHVYMTKSRYRKGAMRALIRRSPRYRVYEGECVAGNDMDVVQNVRGCMPEEYFGRLPLPKLVELASVYPCLVRYFKFTGKFLAEEAGKAGRYSSDTRRRLCRILGIEQEPRTMWDAFVWVFGCLRRGRFEKASGVFCRLSGLGISSEYKVVFDIFARLMSECVNGDGDEGAAEARISHSFEAELSGVSRNMVYKVLVQAFRRGMRRRSRPSAQKD